MDRLIESDWHCKTAFNTTRDPQSTYLTRYAFKTAFQVCFRGSSSDQYNYAQLQTAKQNKGDWVQEFAEQVHGLAQKIRPRVTNPIAQNLRYENVDPIMLLAYNPGLTGTPGTQELFWLHSTLEAAIRIAIVVEQVELQERNGDAF
jgi:hypothetical protein